ncbi:hypothetical protein BN1723_004372 [Verticillium longisporum]|uniref:Uncharacterized protein n=1 Tax=Verticillium longisporum TaxID=100787 RepID=A0A0G4MV99_VERLO|nr:hypothetical protein BN1723_004372 [Verticillium longisporum]
MAGQPPEPDQRLPTCLSLGSTHSYHTASHPLYHGPSSPNDDQSNFFWTVRRAGLGHILVRRIVPGSMPRAQGSISGTSMPSSHILPLGTFVDQWVLARHPSNEPTLTARLSQQPRFKTTRLPERRPCQQTHAGLVVKRPGLVPDLGGTGRHWAEAIRLPCLALDCSVPFTSRQCGPALPRHRKPQTRAVDAWPPIFVMMDRHRSAVHGSSVLYLGLFIALTWATQAHMPVCAGGPLPGWMEDWCETGSIVGAIDSHDPSWASAITEAIPWCRADAVSSAEDMVQFQHESSGLSHSNDL